MALVTTGPDIVAQEGNVGCRPAGCGNEKHDGLHVDVMKRHRPRTVGGLTRLARKSEGTVAMAINEHRQLGDDDKSFGLARGASG